MDEIITCRCGAKLSERQLVTTYSCVETTIERCPKCNHPLRKDDRTRTTNRSAIILEDTTEIEKWVSEINLGFTQEPPKGDRYVWRLHHRPHMTEIVYDPSDGRFIRLRFVSTLGFSKIEAHRDFLPKVCEQFGVQWAGSTSLNLLAALNGDMTQTGGEWSAEQFLSIYTLTPKLFQAVVTRLRDAVLAAEARLPELT